MAPTGQILAIAGLLKFRQRQNKGRFSRSQLQEILNVVNTHLDHLWLCVHVLASQVSKTVVANDGQVKDASKPI